MDSSGFTRGFNDLGVWRLLLYISEKGMSAFLKNTEEPTVAPHTLFEKTWKKTDDSLLHQIETTVYDNPSLLDDYSTEVIIETSKTLQIPNKILDENDGIEEELFKKVYSVEEDDIFTDDNGDETCVYSLAGGLPAFIRRTLPGAKVTSHLSRLICHLRNRKSENNRIYCDIRTGVMDIIAFNGSQLLSASMHGWDSFEDISYQILLLIKAYEISMKKVDIYLSGISEIKNNVASQLREFIENVSFLPLSSIEGVNLPVAGLITLEKS